MRKLDLEHIEAQLKHRLDYKYVWYRKQNDLWDNATRFIYKTSEWDAFLEEVAQSWSKNNFEKEPFFYYAINRWYNFWSAQAVEQIFTSLPGVAPNPNPVEGQYDFRWLGERFDHKTSVFPKGFEGDYAFAKANPKKLITWFYNNQSKGQRHHLNNRIFVVCYAEDGAHYKLKAGIDLLRTTVEDYMKDRTPADTFSLDLQPERETLADIIWVTQ